MSIPRSRTALTTLALALTTALVACGGDDDPTEPEEPDPNQVVEIHLTSTLEFSPSDVTIEPGTTVRWINDADIPHTATPDGHSEWSRWATTAAGETFEHTFDTSGTYDYFCEPHVGQGMVGVIRVQ